MKRIYFFYVVLSLALIQIFPAYTLDSNETWVTPSFFYFFTDKDSHQFREFRGVREDFEAGIDQLEFSKMIGKDLELNFEGHAYVHNNDYNLLLELKNSSDPSKFKLKTGFQSFNRYYDPTGGYFARGTVTNYDLSEKLILFDGKYFIETEFPLFGLQTLAKGSWHHKGGKQSELTWGSGNSTLSRKYVPSFSRIDENVLEAELSFKKEITNGDLTLGQHFIYIDDEPIRKEFNQNGATPRRIVQTIDDDSFHYATHLTLFKALSERTITTLSYYLAFGDTTEKENLETFNNNTGTRIGGGGGTKNIFEAKADNDTQKHILNAHLYRELSKNLSMNVRLNTFYKERYSDGIYPRDTSGTVDFIEDERTTINTEHSGYGLGEHISFRYKGFNRWTPYFRLESEQNFLSLDEDSINPTTPADHFTRVTDQELFKSLGALGFYSYPWNWLKLSAEYNLNHDRDDYKDISESTSVAGTEKSAFVDDITRLAHSVKANVSMALTSWLQAGLRYQWKEIRFAMTPEGGLSATKGFSRAKQYTAVFSILPRADFSLVQMFSFNDLDTYTSARFNNAAHLPRNQGDYKSAVTSLEYSWSPKLHFSFQHDLSWANNFNDFSASGLPLGVDDRYHNLLFEAAWKLKSITIASTFGYGLYRTENKAHIDDYDYHLAMVQVKSSI